MSIPRFARPLCSLILGLSLAGSALADPEVLDGIAAVVNKEVVTFSEVREIVASRERSLRSMYTGQNLDEKIKQLRLAALQELIDRQLIIQDFNKNGYKLPPYVIDEHIKTIIREEFGGDRAAFVRTLQAQGYTLTKFKEAERDKIIVQAMRAQKVKVDTAVSPVQVREYYDKNRREFATNESVQLRMIVISAEPVDGSGNPQSQRRLIEEIRQKAKNGANFAKLAQLYSQDSSAEVGGDWGWIDKKTLNPQMTEIAFGLPTGGVSEVFEMAGNYYLLKVDARKEPIYAPFDQVKGAIENKLKQIERQEATEKWLKTLRDKAYIKRF
ncbi:MAG TPA: peptidyl-prolyl cis-trans isomerase [Chthoniobacterales bacterium]